MLDKKKRPKELADRRDKLARMDMPTCSVPRLFKMLQGEKRLPLDEEYIIQKGSDTQKALIARFRGSEELSVDDLRTFIGLVSIATGSRFYHGEGSDRTLACRTVSPNTKDDLWQKMRLDLVLTDRHKPYDGDEQVIRFETTLYALRAAAGYSNNSRNNRTIMECVSRLQGVSIVVRTEDHRNYDWGWHILNFSKRDEKLSIVLNPHATDAIRGGDGVRWKPIDAIEFRAFKKRPYAQLLYFKLCSVLDSNKLRPTKFRLDTLIDYVWSETMSDDARRRNRGKVRKILQELRELGWQIEPTDKKQLTYNLRRPSIREK